MLSLLGQFSGQEFIVIALALIIVMIISSCVHEFAHAFAAHKQGDLTPKSMGRLTLNPLVHIDPIGFICCVLFGFGWAKPVPVNPLKFRKYRKGMVIVSLAGVTANLVLAFIGCGLYFVCLRFMPVSNYFFFFVLYLFYFLFYLNLSLMIFNLLPIYPLDGFKLIESVTKYNNKVVSFLRQYGSYILLVILIFADALFFKLIDFVAIPMEKLWGLIVGI